MPPSDYIEPLLTIYFAFFIFKIYRRARYNLEPIHLFSLNILLDFATQVVVVMMIVMIMIVMMMMMITIITRQE